MSGTPDMAARLAAALTRAPDPALPGLAEVAELTLLSGGAMQESWAFEARGSFGARRMVLRRERAQLRSARAHGIGLAEEAGVVRLAQEGGAPAPKVRCVLRPEDGLGEGFVMDFIEGETIPRRILRDDRFAELRPRLAAECGRALAAIHRVDPAAAEGLETLRPAETLARIEADYRALDAPGPVFELALRWLHDNLPGDPERLTLVHGDFRNGNLMVRPEGLVAVLDWEGAHIGDPHEDLGYISVASWRFGQIDRPVGGFGDRADFFAAYEAAGGAPVDPARAWFWQLAFTLNWGVQCGQMAQQFLDGVDGSVERGAIGRRRSETEIDLMRMLDGGIGHA